MRATWTNVKERPIVGKHTRILEFCWSLGVIMASVVRMSRELHYTFACNNYLNPKKKKDAKFQTHLSKHGF